MITARHVIDGIRDRGLTQVWLRVNAKSGRCEWIPTDLSQWICPEDASLDIAIYCRTRVAAAFPFSVRGVEVGLAGRIPADLPSIALTD